MRKEAQIVRLIYEMAGEGKSLSRISSRLKEMGIPSPRGKETWSRETLRKILKNEKYTGSVILQKTYVKKFSGTTNKYKMKEQLDLYQINNNHQPIIDDR